MSCQLPYGRQYGKSESEEK